MNHETYWLSRIRPREGLAPAQLVRLGGLTPYGQHQALWKLFKVDVAARNGRVEFLFRSDERNALPVFYLLSRRKPMNAEGIWRIEYKPFRPNIRVGDRLGFKLRVNPIFSKSTGKNQRGKRHDMVMDAKRRMGWKEMPLEQRPVLSHLVQEAGGKWLRARAHGLGVEIDDNLRVDGHRVWRRQGGKGIDLATLDFEGSLSVIDPECFCCALFEGIGPAKAFGCGLMLVRRI